MGIKKTDVAKALGELEDHLEKSSEDDLDQPEGSDMGGGHMGKKMSDEAPAPGKSKKAKKSSSVEESSEEGEDMNLAKAKEVLEKAGYSYSEEDEEKEKKAKKSFAETLPEEIQTKIEVSDFLHSLVDTTGDAIDDLRESLAKSEDTRISHNQDLTEAVEGIQQSQAKVGVVLKAICERIGIIEKSPAREPKAETDLAKSATEPASREFESSLKDEGGEAPMFKSLSNNPIIAKSQIATAMCELVKKGEAEDMDVIGFESSGHLRPEMVSKLQTVLN